MKKAIALVVAVLALLTWALWPASTEEKSAAVESPESRSRTLAEQLDDAELALESSDGGVESLVGVVVDTVGEPVADATVQVLLRGGHLLHEATCDVCGQGILQCTDAHTAREVLAAVKAGRGATRVLATTTTASDGTFHFDAVPQTGVDVMARAPGRTTTSSWQNEGHLTLTLSEEAEARVKVVSTHGPVAGVHVTAISMDSFHWVEAITDASGQLRFAGLDEGLGIWLLLEGPDPFVPLVTQVFSDPEETEVRLSPKRALLVRTLLGGKPTESQVTVTPSAGHPIVQATKGGSARFDGLSGEFALDVKAANETLVAVPQSVSLENELTVVELELRAAARLLVTVVDEQGVAVEEAEVNTSNPQSTDFHNGVVVNGSVVVLGPMGDGKVIVDVMAPPLRPAHRELELHPGDNALEVVLKQGVRLRGVVLGPDDKPAGQTQLEVRGDGEPQPMTFTEDDGSFELTFDEPGLQEITAVSPSMGRATATLQVPADAAVIRLEAKGQLEVFVHEAKTPISGAGVTVTAMGVEATDAIAVTTEDGTVKLSGFASGRYRMTVQQSDFRQRDNLEVVITEGQVTRVDVALDRGMTVKGVVVDAHGSPVEGAEVSTVPWTSSAVSDEQGTFTLITLNPVVPYDVFAATALATSKTKKFTGPQALRLVLVSKPVLTGRVVDARTGEALSQFTVDSTLVDSRDGRFSVPVDGREEGDKASIEFSADGYQVFDWEGFVGNDLDIGTVRLDRTRQIDGIVRDSTGRPVASALVTCDVSADEVTTAYDGTFRLELTRVAEGMKLVARRDQQKGSAPLRMTGSNEIVLQPATQVVGQVFDSSGRGQPGPVTVNQEFGEEEALEVQAGNDGAFVVELAAGRWRFVTRAVTSGQTFNISGRTQRVVLGAAPGSCAVSVTYTSIPDEAMLLPGDAAPSAAIEANDLYAMDGVVAMTGGNTAGVLRASGIKCGVYTLLARWNGVQRLTRFEASPSTPLQLQLADPPELAAQAGLH